MPTGFYDQYQWHTRVFSFDFWRAALISLSSKFADMPATGSPRQGHGLALPDLIIW